ncbi:hypothetical protein [Aquamicrobium ahrensii]|uniref:Uncharacterized protein n=1 Tax=Aquamicrobium ahrensii TaxID=469551 RepID=A0ABV2KHG7_9HYPH
MHKAFLFFSALLMSGPAAASGGFTCSADDGSASINVNGGVTDGMGSPVFSLQGEIGIRDAAVAEDLRKTGFERTHLAQYWLDGSELRLVLYREREGDKPHGYVELTLRTMAQADGAFAGGYVLEVFDMTGATAGEGMAVRLDGAVSCSVE